MGHYTDKARIIKTLGRGEEELVQLTDKIGVNTVDNAEVDDAIAKAEGAIDHALAAAGYATPVATPDERLRTCATDLAVCRLHSHEVPPLYRARCEEAHDWLKRVESGKVTVPGAVRLDQGGTGRVAAGRRTLVFTGDYFARMPGGLDS